MKINLNRINDFDITAETPLDLIIFLMKTTGNTIDKCKIDKKFDKIVNHLKNYKEILEIKDNYDHEDFLKITNYVSDTSEPWNKGILLESFNKLREFYTNFQFPIIDEIEIGSRNNSKPFSYDISMIYCLCQKLHIKTQKEDTILTMVDKIRKIEERKRENFSLIKEKLLTMNSLELSYINSLVSKKKNTYFYNEEKDKEKLENLTKNININYIIKNSILGNQEAIVYAAKFFNFDITESTCPINILKSITEKKDDNIIFEDNDDIFVKKFKINSKFFKLDKFWKKDINFLYQPKLLSNLKLYENVEETDDLDSRYNEDNFYDGILDFEDTTNYDNQKIVSFGNFNAKTFEVIRIEEITQKFKDELNFGKYEKNIEKLVNICRENKDSDYISLHKIIRFIQKYCSLSDENIKLLTKNSKDYESTMKQIFNNLYSISQLLKGKEKIEDLDNISIMNSILNLGKYISDIKNNDLQERIKKLPLVEYKDGNFVKCNNNYYSKIFEDIVNTKNLKDKQSDYLRNKYSLYQFTSYYYMYIFYKEHLFDLQNL